MRALIERSFGAHACALAPTPREATRPSAGETAAGAARSPGESAEKRP